MEVTLKKKNYWVGWKLEPANYYTKQPSFNNLKVRGLNCLTVVQKRKIKAEIKSTKGRSSEGGK